MFAPDGEQTKRGDEQMQCEKVLILGFPIMSQPVLYFLNEAENFSFNMELICRFPKFDIHFRAFRASLNGSPGMDQVKILSRLVTNLRKSEKKML